VVGGDEQSFAGERYDGDTQEPSPPAGDRAPPDVQDGGEERDGDRGVDGSEGEGGGREPHVAHGVGPVAARHPYFAASLPVDAADVPGPASWSAVGAPSASRTERIIMKAAVVRDFAAPLFIEDVNSPIAAVLDGSAGTARTVLRLSPTVTTAGAEDRVLAGVNAR
jgi:hypothetical protein